MSINIDEINKNQVIKTINNSNFENILAESINCFDFKDNIVVLSKEFSIDVYKYENNKLELKKSKTVASEKINNLLINGEFIFATFGNKLYSFNFDLEVFQFHETNYSIINNMHSIANLIILITDSKINVYQILGEDLLLVRIITTHEKKIRNSYCIKDEYLMTNDEDNITHFFNCTNYNFDSEYTFLDMPKNYLKFTSIKNMLIFLDSTAKNLLMYNIEFNENKISIIKNIESLTFNFRISTVFTKNKLLFVVNDNYIHIFKKLSNKFNKLLIINLGENFKEYKINDINNLVLSKTNNTFKIFSSKINLEEISLLNISGLANKFVELKINNKINLVEKNNEYYKNEIIKVKKNMEDLDHKTVNRGKKFEENKKIVNENLNKILELKIEKINKLKIKTENICEFHNKKVNIFKKKFNLSELKELLDEHYKILNE